MVLVDSPVSARGVGPDDHIVKEKMVGQMLQERVIKREKESERERQGVER